MEATNSSKRIVDKQACALSFLFARKSLHIGNLPYNRRGTLQSPRTYFFNNNRAVSSSVKHTSSKMKNGGGQK
jgi:hypothetical protein